MSQTAFSTPIVNITTKLGTEKRIFHKNSAALTTFYSTTQLIQFREVSNENDVGFQYD